MKSTSFSSKFVKSPAKLPGLSKTGPEVILQFTPSSLAIICAKVVFPNPGGPCKSTWSKAPPLFLAAATKTSKLSNVFLCPAKSLKLCGRICSSCINSSSEKFSLSACKKSGISNSTCYVQR